MSRCFFFNIVLSFMFYDYYCFINDVKKQMYYIKFILLFICSLVFMLIAYLFSYLYIYIYIHILIYVFFITFDYVKYKVIGLILFVCLNYLNV